MLISGGAGKLTASVETTLAKGPVSGRSKAGASLSSDEGPLESSAVTASECTSNTFVGVVSGVG